MRAVICRAWGEVDSLRVEEIAPPAPAADEVLIDVRATAVNYADSIMVAGRYQTRPPSRSARASRRRESSPGADPP
jgi:NADPH2:quinone reductase